MIVQLAEGTIQTKYGVYREVLFYDGIKESHALIMGDITDGEDILCRIHSSCIFAHHFNSIECDCREQMEISQQLIEKEGRGIVIWLEQEGKGNGHYALLNTLPYKKDGMPQVDAYEAVGFQKDARDFSAAAKILKHLNVVSIVMLTNNAKKIETITRYEITVSGIQLTVLEK